MQEIKRVVVIGPESTGKSTLCTSLAEHYNTAWCPEYAREYLLQNGTNYTYDDLLLIAKGQLELEERFAAELRAQWKNKVQQTAQPLLFVDTDMYVMKVWCEYVFGKCHSFILDKIVEKRTDLYLLCNVDLPWVKDELREYPDVQARVELYHIYKDILVNQAVPWENISGTNEERVDAAIAAVKKVF
jgi:NadR type nicotinamide-nucleotide adenylyltransferase